MITGRGLAAAAFAAGAAIAVPFLLARLLRPKGSVLYVQPAVLRSLKGRVAVVSGASGGVGLRLAQELARLGATVILGCRNVSKGYSAAQRIADMDVPGSVEMLELDLSSFASVRRFASDFKARYRKLDYLVCNAGVMAVPERRVTKDGFELQMGVNHLGHFLLTELLLDRVKNCRGRICIVSSRAHHGRPPSFRAAIDFDDLFSEKEGAYDPQRCYCLSKLANVLHARELARRLNGTGVIVASCHPGHVDTAIARHLGPFDPRGLQRRIARPILSQLGMVDVYAGIQAQLHILLAPASELTSGDYYAQFGGFFGGGEGGWPQQTSEEGRDMDAARRLWDASERLTRTRRIWR